MRKLLEINFIMLILLTIFFKGTAQDIKYARKIIKKLCAPSYHGRGYIKKGDIKAAKYIVKQLKHSEVKPFNESYLQAFSINVNTFNKAVIKLDDNKLKAGVDFYVNAYSQSCKGKYPVVSMKHVLIDSIKSGAIQTIHHKAFFLYLDTIPDNFESLLKTYIISGIFSLKQVKGFISVEDKLGAFYLAPATHDITDLTLRKGCVKKTPQHIYLDIKNNYLKNHQTNNIIGYIPGKIDSFIVYTAHYDHLGRMGKKAYFPGAHDNASGTAMVLDLARYYADKVQNKYGKVFILFSAEEIGLIGSNFFTENPLFELDRIKFLINLDLVGSGDDGITIVNGSVFEKEFSIFKEINTQKKYLKQIKERGAAKNSDHYYFYEKGVKSFFIYTLGQYKEYHNIYDTSKNVPLNAYNELFLLLTDFTKRIETNK